MLQIETQCCKWTHHQQQSSQSTCYGTCYQQRVEWLELYTKELSQRTFQKVALPGFVGTPTTQLRTSRTLELSTTTRLPLTIEVDQAKQYLYSFGVPGNRKGSCDGIGGCWKNKFDQTISSALSSLNSVIFTASNVLFPHSTIVFLKLKKKILSWLEKSYSLLQIPLLFS